MKAKTVLSAIESVSWYLLDNSTSKCI